LQAASAALKAAERGVKLAGGDDKAAKKQAEVQLEAAALQVELAKVRVLCRNAHANLRSFFGLPHSAMRQFRFFSM